MLHRPGIFWYYHSQSYQAWWTFCRAKRGKSWIPLNSAWRMAVFCSTGPRAAVPKQSTSAGRGRCRLSRAIHLSSYPWFSWWSSLIIGTVWTVVQPMPWKRGVCQWISLNRKYQIGWLYILCCSHQWSFLWWWSSEVTSHQCDLHVAKQYVSLLDAMCIMNLMLHQVGSNFCLI